MSKLVVVGGGIAGLVAATFAARGGAQTVLLEAGSEPGGRAITREHKGFRFNVGPHALYLAGAAGRTLQALGIDLPGAPPPSSGARFVHGGELHRMPASAAEFAQTSLFQAEDMAELGRVFKVLGEGFRGEDGDTVGQALDRLTGNGLVRSVIEAQIRVSTYANAPEVADAATAFDQLLLAVRGVHYLDGGWGSMIAALAQTARKDGVEIRLGCRVAALRRDADSWSVVCSDGETLEATAVVLAIDPRQAAGLAPGAAALERGCQNLRAPRVASLDLALSHLPRPEHTFALGLDEPTYFSVHSLAAKQLAPEGGAMIHVSRYLEPNETSSKSLRSGLERLLDLLQPGWRDVLVHAQWLPQVHVAHDMPQASLGALRGRIPVELAPGLFAAGDWAGAEGMLADAAFASGRLAGETGAGIVLGRAEFAHQ